MKGMTSKYPQEQTPFLDVRSERMRIKITISLMFVFTLLAINAYAILQPNEVLTGGGESLADKLIEASQGKTIYKPTDTRFPANPKGSRSLQENKSLVWTPMPETLSSGKSPEATRTQSQGQGDEGATAFMSDTTVAGTSVGTQTPTPTANAVAGTWSLDLNDTASKQVVLTLFQVEDKVFGSGSMKNGNDTLAVAASGALKDDQIYLDITSIGTISLYSLVMTSNGDRSGSVSGDYKAYAANGQTWMGKVQGGRSLPKS